MMTTLSAALPPRAEPGAFRVLAALAALCGWVLGVAVQLQQVALWPWPAYAGVGVLALGLGGALGWRPRRVLWAGLLLGLLAGTGAGWGLTGVRAVQTARQALDPALQGQDLQLTGRIAGLPQPGALGTRFEFEVATAHRLDTGAPVPVAVPPRLQLNWYAPAGGGPALRAGDGWRFTARLRSPHGNANPHGFDRERWLWQNGIGATGQVRLGPRDVPPQRLAVAGPFSLQAWRQRVGERIVARVPDDPRSAGVLAALVVGNQGAIDRDDWALFRTTGVAHLMSISGLHVTMFAWLATALVGWAWRRLARRWPGLALAWPVPLAAGLGGVALAAAYALFSGWGVPAQRTLVMLAVVVGLRLGARRWPWPVVWGLAMAAVLLLDPWAWLQAGFWLSFVAVGVLFAAGSTPAGVVPGSRPLGALARLLREQAVVTLALAPLSLLLFGQWSLVGLVANLVAIPWVTLLVTPLALLGVGLPFLWDLAAWAVQVLAAALAWLAQWPWAALYRAIPPVPLGVAGVLGGTLLVLRLPLVARGAGLLLMVPALAWAPARPAEGQFELLALDVGQGGAVLVRTAGHSLLYDTGPRYAGDSDAGERVVVPLLRALGERLDTVVVSHGDSDHAGGADAVHAAQPQARWLSSVPSLPGERCQAGQHWVWDGVDFELLHPLPDAYAADGSGRLSSNAMSCVLRVSAGGQSAWLAGDLDAAQEVRLALVRPDLRARVMLAPHHGSRSSSSPVLLNTLRPDWVLVQAGYRNRFGHPDPEVLARYRQRGIRWVASPDCGAALWRSAVPDAVRCQRDRDRRYWHHPGGAVPAVGGVTDSPATPPG